MVLYRRSGARALIAVAALVAFCVFGVSSANAEFFTVPTAAAGATDVYNISASDAFLAFRGMRDGLESASWSRTLPGGLIRQFSDGWSAPIVAGDWAVYQVPVGGYVSLVAQNLVTSETRTLATTADSVYFYDATACAKGDWCLWVENTHVWGQPVTTSKLMAHRFSTNQTNEIDVDFDPSIVRGDISAAGRVAYYPQMPGYNTYAIRVVDLAASHAETLTCTGAALKEAWMGDKLIAVGDSGADNVLFTYDPATHGLTRVLAAPGLSVLGTWGNADWVAFTGAISSATRVEDLEHWYAYSPSLKKLRYLGNLGAEWHSADWALNSTTVYALRTSDAQPQPPNDVVRSEIASGLPVSQTTASRTPSASTRTLVRKRVKVGHGWIAKAPVLKLTVTVRRDGLPVYRARPVLERSPDGNTWYRVKTYTTNSKGQATAVLPKDLGSRGQVMWSIKCNQYYRWFVPASEGKALAVYSSKMKVTIK